MTFRGALRRIFPAKAETLAEVGRLPEPFRAILLSMYANEPQLGTGGDFYAMDGLTKINPSYAMWLHDFAKQVQPNRTLEVGLAYGFSTVCIMAAMQERADHTAVDPFQKQDWSGIGIARAKLCGLEDRFRFLDLPSSFALPSLRRDGEQFELIYIDGGHRFDDVLVDFTLAAEVCPIGGHIVLDDLWMPSIRRVVKFIETNRSDFRRADIQTPENFATFQRVTDDRRAWNFDLAF